MTANDPATPVPAARFGPLVLLTAIVCGSAIAIAFGLNAVLVIFWILREESAEISTEIARLPLYCALFLALTAVSTAALYSMLKQRPWQRRAQWLMWLLLAAICGWFWQGTRLG